jgi:hypothetical protein
MTQMCDFVVSQSPEAASKLCLFAQQLCQCSFTSVIEIGQKLHANKVMESGYGTKRQFARCKGMSGVGGKADLPVERPDFSL